MLHPSSQSPIDHSPAPEQDGHSVPIEVMSAQATLSPCYYQGLLRFRIWALNTVAFSGYFMAFIVHGEQEELIERLTAYRAFMH